MVLARSWKPAPSNEGWKLDAAALPVVCLITPRYKRLRPADNVEEEGEDEGRLY